MTMLLDLPEELAGRVSEEARRLGVSPEQRIQDILEGAVALAETLDPGKLHEGVARLKAFLERIPCIPRVSNSGPSVSSWWLKFEIDLHSAIAWHAVQHLGFVLN